jgi:D-glycero-alpha-D-manno-heptose 1-phosphate guanylyltransferase
MVTTAIILAGGFGTRLASVVNDVPKPMAPVADKPFLEWQLQYLSAQGITRVVLAVSHKRDVIQDHFGSAFKNLDIQYSVEEQPLGTGGGIKQAFEMADAPTALVLNGDSVFICPLAPLFETHSRHLADITIALKRMYKFDRYGTVELDAQNRIQAFNEKTYCDEGLINTGVYVINKNVFDGFETGIKFSFEKDVMEKHTQHFTVAGCVAEGYFIDIGIPEDYTRAQTEIPAAII